VALLPVEVPSPPPINRLAYKPADAARELGISRARLYELLKSGEIPAVKLGRRTLIRREALVSYLDSLDGWEPRSDTEDEEAPPEAA
jgi:excisionase family DNA binding protein